MLTEYIQAAMRQAHYEIMEDGRIFGTVPPCQGVWADADTVEECREKLRSVLEGWLLLGFRFGDHIPPVDGIDLNPPRGSRAATGRRTSRKAGARRRAEAHV